MKLELASVSNLLVHMLRLSSGSKIPEEQLGRLRDVLVEVLRRRYRDHWFPEKPFKGSGYRCIRINERMDPVIAQAAEVCGLDPHQFHKSFPSEMTIWIDPLEVSYRIGENGSICVLYEFQEGVENKPWEPNNAKKLFETPHPQQHEQERTRPKFEYGEDFNFKEALRKMDYLLEPNRKMPDLIADCQEKDSSKDGEQLPMSNQRTGSVSIEALAAFVSRN